MAIDMTQLACKDAVTHTLPQPTIDFSDDMLPTHSTLQTTQPEPEPYCWTPSVSRALPLCVAASVYRMSAANCLSGHLCSSTTSSPPPAPSFTDTDTHPTVCLSDPAGMKTTPWLMPTTATKALFAQPHMSHRSLDYISPCYRRAPVWELLRQADPSHRICYGEDFNSGSSSGTFDDSSDSGRSYSPVRKQTKRSHHLLLREIRRLRAENDSLKSSIHILKDDLRVERESRRIAEACHQKFCEEFMDRHTRLEMDAQDKQDEIDSLKEKILESSLSSNSSTTSATHTEEDDHDDTWKYVHDQPEFDNLPGGEAVAGPNFLSSYSHEIDSEEDEQDDEDDAEEAPSEEQFEELAASYLRQALISNLTSARANLELDDLVLKYDPSPDVLLRTLAGTFILWIDGLLAGADSAKAMLGQVQGEFLRFWKSILETHVHDDADQVHFLNEAERTLSRDDARAVTALADNFHQLLVMLYKYDIVDSDAVSHWWHTHHAKDSAGRLAQRLRQVTRKFVEWVDEDEEDEDEDEDEDVDTDDDDDVDSLVEDSDVETVTDAHDDETMDLTAVHGLDDMLEEDREYCACQFDDDPDPSTNPPAHTTLSITTTTPPSNSSASPHGHCTCGSTYTPPPSTHHAETLPAATTIDKPKKSVRILL
ncbi:hypothetical protein BCR43DRAFT_564545 [Syncephalastrum racemosum]|uniref:W2 domain-containing protein n=1 Tax=Syncephalastrum racemosum TaxID=13706 RepID=A0A1X2HAM8_SYNRA|nr:hypothetical protein BCR43DRAFT_564545 [Syncephalastrum racemosum]